MLEIKNLSVAFGNGPKVVWNTSMKVEDHVNTCIIGETGSGKSVLLLSLLQLLPPSAQVTGEIIHKGRDINQCTPKEMIEIRKNVFSYVPQGSGNGLNPLYKISKQFVQNIQFHEKGMKKKDAYEMAKSLLIQFGLDDADRVLNSYPHQLSGGMRQRVLVAMGVSTKADVILIDEPTKGLDQSRINMVIDTFKKLENKTVLTVTHDLRFAKEVATNIVVMYASEVIEESIKEAFFNEPLHPYAKAMLDALPENGLSAQFGFAPPRTEEDLTNSCHFIHRCPYKNESCNIKPPLFEVEGRKVRCWKYAAECQ